MKFCSNCGAQMADDSKFCMECGQKFEVAAPAAPAAPAAMNYAPPAEPVYAAPAEPAPVYAAPAEPAPVYAAPAEPAPAEPAPVYAAPAAPQQPAAPQSFAPQGYAPAAPQQPAAPQSFAPQGYAPAAPQQPAAPQNFAPQGYAPAAPQQPAPQNFAPPAPQGFAPQQGFAPAPAPQPKKGGGKKVVLFAAIGVVAVAVIALVLILILGGGGAGKDDPNLGLYEGTSCEALGMELGADGEWVELKAGGKADLYILATELSGKWKLDGEDLTVTVSGVDYEGTLANGVMVLDIYEMIYTFEKEGAAGDAAADDSAADAPDVDVPAVDDAEVAEPVTEGFAPVTGTLENCTVTVQGAESFVDSNGEDAIRVYYDFTNNTDDSVSPWAELYITAEQDGYDAEITYSAWEDTVPEESNSGLTLRPGCTNRCVEQFALKLDGGPITITIADYWEENPIVVEFDPQNLPGRPAADFVAATVSNPQWISNWPDRGVLDEKYEVYIDTAEVVESYYGGSVVRVYYEFTNNSEEAASFWLATYYSAYQDGIELATGYAAEDVAEDENTSVDVAPGETIRCAVCFELRNETSPIEVEVYDFWSDIGVGCVFNFN